MIANSKNDGNNRYDRPPKNYFRQLHFVLHVKESLFFGYESKLLDDRHSILFATPEKALLDLLYLYPFYNTSEEIENLRLDDTFMHEEFDFERFKKYLALFNSKALEKRASILLKTFDYD